MTSQEITREEKDLLAEFAGIRKGIESFSYKWWLDKNFIITSNNMYNEC